MRPHGAQGVYPLTPDGVSCSLGGDRLSTESNWQPSDREHVKVISSITYGDRSLKTGPAFRGPATQPGCLCDTVDDVTNHSSSEVIVDDLEFVGCREISPDLFG